MIQINIFCEGQTEQIFCAQVLQPHLFPTGSGIIHTLAVGSKNHSHVYGLGRHAKYERVRKFIGHAIKQRQGDQVYFTTLFDLYGLPDDFPGKEKFRKNPTDPGPYAIALEQEFNADIGHHQFFGYLQLHEYETMLFSDPEAFAIAFDHCEEKIERLKHIARSFPNIECIDEGKTTAPSKRIIDVIPEYQGRKTTAGPDIADYIGVTKIRAACPHFHQWLVRLESIALDETRD